MTIFFRSRPTSRKSGYLDEVGLDQLSRVQPDATDDSSSHRTAYL
jgi:hypothetical protein